MDFYDYSLTLISHDTSFTEAVVYGPELSDLTDRSLEVSIFQTQSEVDVTRSMWMILIK